MAVKYYGGERPTGCATFGRVAGGGRSRGESAGARVDGTCAESASACPAIAAARVAERVLAGKLARAVY